MNIQIDIIILTISLQECEYRIDKPQILHTIGRSDL